MHLYGPKQPPNWLFKLPLDSRFVWHNDRRLFSDEQIIRKLLGLSWKPEAQGDELSADTQASLFSPGGSGIGRLPSPRPNARSLSCLTNSLATKASIRWVSSWKG